MSPVSTVIWDMGNVLFPFDRNRQAASLQRLPGCRRELSEIMPFIDGGEQQVAYELGRMDREAFLGCLAEFLGTTADKNDVEEAYSDLFIRNEGVCALAKSLAPTSLIATNTDPSHLARVRRDYPDVMSLYPVDRVADSVSLGVRKPDPAFYARLVQLSGCPAESLLFFDDLPANVSAAREAGLESIVFDGDVDRIIAELLTRGIELRGNV